MHRLLREGGEMLVKNGGGEICFPAIQWMLGNTLIALGSMEPQFVFIYPARETIQEYG